MENFPLSSYCFKVVFDNQSFSNDLSFISVSGLDAQLVFQNSLTQKIEGNTFGNVCLKRALKTPSKLTLAVLETINNKKVQSLSFTIVLLDSKNQEQIKWYVAGAQPVRYAVEEFNSTLSGIAIEVFEFRCNYMHVHPPTKKM